MNLEEANFQIPNGLRLVKRLPANHAGRDFVVGDLHGCRKELDRLMQLVEFDSKVDRLISVGDLVDRGPQSMDCLGLLKAPWFHAVMGNHEQLMLNFFAHWLADGGSADPYGDVGMGFLMNGGNWALHECDSRWRPVSPLRELLLLAADLPQVLVIGEGRERYNVVHAELWRTASQGGEGVGVWSDADIDALPERAHTITDYPAFRWSRKLMGNRRRTGRPTLAPGLSLTYCGHSVAPGVRSALSHVCLDTGAFMLYGDTPTDQFGLTLAEVKERRYMTLRGFYLEDGEF